MTRRGTAGWDYLHIAIDDCTRLAHAEGAGRMKASTPIAHGEMARPSVSRVLLLCHRGGPGCLTRLRRVR